MLGHKVWQVLHDRFDTRATVRAADVPWVEVFTAGRAISNVRADDFDSVVRACAEARPQVIVNCIGLVKQIKAASDPMPGIAINALFPHRLAALARAAGARLLHISTDCVFAGTRGGYSESDAPDAADLYGRTKLLGEVTGAGCLTLRTSIIGRELSGTTALAEWFLAHRGGRVTGYTHARFSGLTTGLLAQVIGDLIEKHPALDGLYHMASVPISKYDLLRKLNDAFDAGVTIDPSDQVRIDRSLDGSRFAAATGWTVPTWDAMVAALAADPTPYEEWRSRRV